MRKSAPAPPIPYSESEHALVRDLLDIRKNLPSLNRLEALHDATDRREEAQHMFTLGLLDLPDKAKIETLYWEIGQGVVQSFRGQAYVPEEVRKLEDSLGDQVLCNFSVFQSLLDHWALGQLFPIMPVSRLNERPTREGTLVDITCDSDGEVKKFIDLSDVRDTLPLHAPRSNGNGAEPYYLGFFLMGAYQDIMGDLHNLFGRVNELHVFLDPDEPAGYYVEEIIEGSTIVQTLTSVQYDENELKRQMKMQIDEAIKSDRLKPSEGMRLLDDYERGLKEYTYLTILKPDGRRQSRSDSGAGAAGARPVHSLLGHPPGSGGRRGNGPLRLDGFLGRAGFRAGLCSEQPALVRPAPDARFPTAGTRLASRPASGRDFRHCQRRPGALSFLVAPVSLHPLLSWPASSFWRRRAFFFLFPSTKSCAAWLPCFLMKPFAWKRGPSPPGTPGCWPPPWPVSALTSR